MKRIYKYLVSVILMIVCMCIILLIPNESKAIISYDDAVEMNIYTNDKLDRLKASHAFWTSNIWDKGSSPLRMRYPVLLLRKDLYCVARTIPLNHSPKYENIKYVRINGTTATDEAGRTVNHYNNAVLAYILSKGTGGHANRNTPGTFGNGENENLNDLNNFSDTQIAVFMFINEWFETVGRDLNFAWSHYSNPGVSDPEVQATNPQRYQSALNIVAEAKSDASKLGSTTRATAKNNTNKNNVKVSYYTSNNTQYIKVGPFNWTYTGTLTSVTVTGNNGAKPSLKYFGSDGNTEISMSGIKSGSNFYVAFRADTGMTSISSITGTVTAPGGSNVSAELWFLNDVKNELQHVMLTDHNITTTESTTAVVPPTTNIPLTLSFSIVKVDEDNNNIKLSNVGFKFYNKTIGKYLRISGSTVQYVDTLAQATELLTDQNGVIKLNNVLVGTYVAYETKNPNYGYEVDGSGKEFNVSNGSQITIGNRKIYIRLSGFVWEDVQSEKMSIRNDLYNLDANDDEDRLMPGVTVHLINTSNSNLNQTTTTDDQGEYMFEDVVIDEVVAGHYYIEFEYDGLIYESVIPHLENVEKGSKVDEPGRDEFNDRFNSMEKGNGDHQTIADQNGQTENKPTINYGIDESNSGPNGTILVMESTENTEIVSTTTEAGYTIDYSRGEDIDEITNINLGLFRRPQIDLATQTELEQIKVEIAGYGHIYKYGPKYTTEEAENSWNLGVRFENTYKGTYERPIYQADVAYENTEDPSQELKLSLTYKITIRNQGSVYAKVNEIIAYFDARYDEINAVGTEVDAEGNVNGNLTGAIDETFNSNGYKRVTIDTSGLNQIIDYVTAPGDGDKVIEQNIYIQFNLPKEIIAEMLNEGDSPENNLNFTSEVGSYTSYSDREGTTLYAAYDLDSVPDNAQVGEFSTYEDDTDKASQVALTIADARTVRGNVFEDLKEESEENVAEGNGMQDEDETNLNGVRVELIDANENTVANIYDAASDVWAEAGYDVSDTDGSYTIAGFIPGEYQIRFTWGDGDGRRTQRIVEPENADPITVENYKSTIIGYDKYQKYEAMTDEEKGKYYLDEEIVDGSSIALDDPDIRGQIDEDLRTYKHDTTTDITEMESNTWTMNFPVEYDADEIINAKLEQTNDAKQDTNAENEHKIIFLVNNINLGIIRRPEQDIKLEKEVSGFKFTLPTGQVLVDATVNDDGTLSGATNYLSYIGNRENPSQSILRLEIDEMLIQSSTLEIKYKFKLTNVGEADYSNESYYNYGEGYYEVVGELQKDNDVITLTPLLIADYLQEDDQYDVTSTANNQYAWRSVSIDDLDVSDDVKEALKSGTYNSEDIGNYQIYVTDYCDTQDMKLKPIYYKGDTQAENSGNVETIEMDTSKSLNSTRGASNQNDSEIILVVKTGGGRLTSTPGNYVPNKTSDKTPDLDDATSEQTVVIPSTGENMDYTIPIIIGVIVCVILFTGIYIIKVKILNNKEE